MAKSKILSVIRGFTMNKVMIMSHTYLRNFLLTIGCFFLVSTVVAAQGTNEFRQTLPPGFAALVPQGTKLVNPKFSRSIVSGYGTAEVEFYAEKEVDKGTQLIVIRYHLKLDCLDDKSWKINGSQYPSIVEQKAEEKREVFAKGTGGSIATGKTFYPPEMKKYSWGYGITQRTDTYDIGLGANAPPITTYNCFYFGMAKTGMFEASVIDFLDSKDEAEKWIAKVALKASQTDITNISE
jgi:hypothetical protein